MLTPDLSYHLGTEIFYDTSEGLHRIPLLFYWNWYIYLNCRADRRIKHCVIKEDGRLFTIGLNKFETLFDLISFYEKHEFYNRVSLILPVTEDLIRKMGIVSSLEAYYELCHNYLPLSYKKEY